MFIATLNGKSTLEYDDFVEKAMQKTGIDSDDIEGYVELIQKLTEKFCGAISIMTTTGKVNYGLVFNKKTEKDGKGCLMSIDEFLKSSKAPKNRISVKVILPKRNDKFNRIYSKAKFKNKWNYEGTL